MNRGSFPERCCGSEERKHLVHGTLHNRRTPEQLTPTRLAKFLNVSARGKVIPTSVGTLRMQVPGFFMATSDGWRSSHELYQSPDSARGTPDRAERIH